MIIYAYLFFRIVFAVRVVLIDLVVFTGLVNDVAFTGLVVLTVELDSLWNRCRLNLSTLRVKRFLMFDRDSRLTLL